MQLNLTDETESSTRSGRFDFYLAAFYRIREGKFCIYYTSIENEEILPNNGYLRAEFPLGGMILTPDLLNVQDKKDSHIVHFKSMFYLHSLFKARVPGWVSKQLFRLITTSIQSIQQIHFK